MHFGVDILTLMTAQHMLEIHVSHGDLWLEVVNPWNTMFHIKSIILRLLRGSQPTR